MPDFVQVKRKVKLSEEAYDIYQKVEKEFIHEMAAGTILAANKGAASMKCRQIANGAVYDIDGKALIIHGEKLEALQDIIEETNGHPLLIMYEFKHDRDRIKKRLGTDCVCITGMKGKTLTDVLTRFNEGKLKYLLMHPQSSHGINIQKACNHVVWFSIIWDLELFIQATTRLHRQGQTSPTVMCYMLTAESTIDEVVAKALAAKARTQESIEKALRKYCGMV
jgi:SNF2 family DNA or RNA helicase